MKSLFRLTLLVSCIFIVVHMAFVDKSLTTKKHTEWKKLILTHHLPVTVCKMAKEKCENPPNYWTLHGLWTDKAQMCNHSWAFNYTEIEDLVPDMNKYWPNILHPNQTWFWKHEWMKHGTCAASLPALNTQHNYFSKGLYLFQGMELNSALAKSQITPSGKYQKEDIEKAFLSLYGVLPKIQCLPPGQGEETQMLGQIEVCFTKDFNLLNCTSGPEDYRPVNTTTGQSSEELHVCDNKIPIYYPSVANYPSVA